MNEEKIPGTKDKTKQDEARQDSMATNVQVVLVPLSLRVCQVAALIVVKSQAQFALVFSQVILHKVWVLKSRPKSRPNVSPPRKSLQAVHVCYKKVGQGTPDKRTTIPNNNTLTFAKSIVSIANAIKRSLR